MSLIIHNATFMMEREREAEFVTWLSAQLENIEMGEGLNPRISAMREAGGVDYRQAEAQSVAFQVEFPDIDSARAWGSDKFSSLAAAFEEKFGPQAMVFVSMFEVLN